MLQALVSYRLIDPGSEAGRFARLLEVRIPAVGEPISAAADYWRLNRRKYCRIRCRDGRYLLRSNQTAMDPAELWEQYMVLIEVDEAFRNLKGNLAIRPIHHQLESRIEAHIFVAFMACCSHVMLRQLARSHAPGLTPLKMSRYTKPDRAQQPAVAG